MEGGKKQNRLLAAELVLLVPTSGHCHRPQVSTALQSELLSHCHVGPLFPPFIFWGMNEALTVILGLLTFGF